MSKKQLAPKKRNTSKQNIQGNPSQHSHQQQNQQDFGNQSSIIADENNKNINKMEFTNNSMNFLEEIDQKWMELKITGKNILRRSYHSAVIYEGYMYIYGGYDVNSGILQDFWKINIDEPESYEWKNLTPGSQAHQNSNQQSLLNFPEDNDFNMQQAYPKYPGPRERHQAFVYEDKMYIFGGLKNTLENTNQMHSYDFKTNTWDIVIPLGDVQPQPIDSHSVVLNEQDGEFYLYGGFLGRTKVPVTQYHKNAGSLTDIENIQQIKERDHEAHEKEKIQREENEKQVGGYNKDLFKFDLKSDTWSILPCNSEKTPPPRSGSSICYANNKIFMFGGSNVSRKFSDFWYYENGDWNEIQQPTVRPESRNGHSLILFQDQILLFGGIHDITHEKNDLLICDSQTLEWKVVDVDTSHKKEEGDASPRENQFEENDLMKNISQSQKFVRTNNGIQPDIYNKKQVQPSKRMYQTFRANENHNTSLQVTHHNNLTVNTQFNNTKQHNHNTTNNLNNQTQENEKIQSAVYQQEESQVQINQMEENKKKRQELKKKALLDEFKLNDKEQETFKSNSPTLIAMKNTIISVGNPEGKKKYDLKAQYKSTSYQKPFDFRSNKIIGKAPSARDGQSATVHENYCVIFGGDRHLMSYNDLFQIDLELATGKKLPQKPKKEKNILPELQEEENNNNTNSEQQAENNNNNPEPAKQENSNNNNENTNNNNENQQQQPQSQQQQQDQN